MMTMTLSTIRLMIVGEGSQTGTALLNLTMMVMDAMMNLKILMMIQME